MSILKVIIPFVLIGLGASGIFLASTLSFAIACLIGIIILTTKLKHIIKLQFDKVLAKQMRRFSVENYLATFIEGLSISLLPILITNRINANISGYFYIDTMIINALYVIPSAISQVLFAEGSSKEQSLAGIYKKALKFIYIFMVPAIILLILCGRYILEIFGESFATYGYGPLVLFSLAGIPVAAKLLTNAIFNIERKVILVIITDIITVSIVMSISYILLPKGLVWVGVAWVIGESIGALVALALLLFKSNTLESHPYRRKLLQLYELARQ
jgi:O-antigen/teichoic acid export membrane protein